MYPAATLTLFFLPPFPASFPLTIISTPCAPAFCISFSPLNTTLLHEKPLSTSALNLFATACASSSGFVISLISSCGLSIPNFLPIVSVRREILLPLFPIASPGLVTFTTILVTSGVLTISDFVNPALSSSFAKYLSSSTLLRPCFTKNFSITNKTPVDLVHCLRLLPRQAPPRHPHCSYNPSPRL